MSSCDCCMPCVVCSGWTDGTGDTNPECKHKKLIDKEVVVNTPKVGDRVRVVIEGEVHHVTQDGFLDVAGVYYSSELGKYGVVSIEVIPVPFVLPTKRWAQVIDEEENLWTRRSLDNPDFQEWVDLEGHKSSSEDLLLSSGLRVISEGAS